ncbi:MAG: hypothetical protein JRI23_12175 [Deltaproteobacteria bacterium]|nr:hypothetical protein [Deltaproteobacteria bacterium]MBW2532468.1 hypothetical protein [Deltaproteobacteria bacterium]
MRGLSVGVAAVAALGLLYACSEDPEAEAIVRALGEGCLLDSDCEGDLVCVFRRCHQECNTSEDCPLDGAGDHERCVCGEHPHQVCQLEADKFCRYDSECPGLQVCGLDERCRDACAADRDCLAGQVCRSATCAELEELDPDGRLVAAAANGLGRRCFYSSDCLPGPGGLTLWCNDGVCVFACYEERDCPRFFDCTTPANPAAPGDCEPINDDPTQLFCDPDDPVDGEVECDCMNGVTRLQRCKSDGSGYEVCPCD